MANPVLNERTFKNASQGAAAWAPPDPATRQGRPIDDGPISEYRSIRDSWTRVERMSVSGTITAVGVLFVLLLVGGFVGWTTVSSNADTVEIPGWFFLPLIGALVLAIVTSFKPTIARFTSPAYAVLEGVVLGVISKLYNVTYDGIVLQAVGMTAAVFAVMWFLYATRIIKVTDRFRKVIMAATFGVMIFYGISLLAHLFGATVPFINSASAGGIAFSVVVAGIAAFNLALDFDLIEKGAASGAPKYMEWYAAFGLMVTVVWLYLEILRLLAKLRER